MADPVIKSLIGDIPYINGGIFAVHELEAAHSDISIPDDIFESIFDLFDSYQWHLDDRPTASQNEINPDVLGYIFEQFINQKEQGAYYTKDDVTHFMTSSTLLPVFLERLQAKTGINPWDYVVKEPAAYLWDSLHVRARRGIPDEVEEQRARSPGRPGTNAHRRRTACPESLGGRSSSAAPTTRACSTVRRAATSTMPTRRSAPTSTCTVSRRRSSTASTAQPTW